MSEATVRCDRCHLTILVAKLNPPPPYERCLDHRCPLHTAEKNSALAAALDKIQLETRPVRGEPIQKPPIVAPTPVELERRPPPPSRPIAAPIITTPRKSEAGYGARVAADLAARKAARENGRL